MSWKELFSLFCLLTDQINRFERVTIGGRMLGIQLKDLPCWKKRQLAMDLQSEVRVMMEEVQSDEWE